MINNLKDYLFQSRWCNFKEDLQWGRVRNLQLTELPFDDDKKLFVLGTAEVAQEGGQTKKHYFSMPLAVRESIGDNESGLILNGKYYTDALNESDFWRSMIKLIKDNDGKVVFPNGWTLELNGSEIIDEHENDLSKPLGVEQSNTTLAVGDKELAFKLERMLDFSTEVNPEFEMNDKLMRENATVMPETYGYLVWRNENGEISSSGIVQQFVKNKGDMWGYLQEYLATRLQENWPYRRPLRPEESGEVIALMQRLNEKTMEMGQCFEKPDDNPSFSPEVVDEEFISQYARDMYDLMKRTKKVIMDNFMRLPQSLHNQARALVGGFDENVGDFVEKHLSEIRGSENKGTRNRVHGDFHLGQVMVTLDNDLTFIDFAGEPSLDIEQRKQKHIYIRDVAGMYRSIKGYLGAVAVEEFASKAINEENAQERRAWASEAISPLIDAFSQTFLGEHKLSEPWLSLEILRKNLYEVEYEVANRPAMAYVPISGLYDLLNASKGAKEGHVLNIANSNENFGQAL